MVLSKFRSYGHSPIECTTPWTVRHGNVHSHEKQISTHSHSALQKKWNFPIGKWSVVLTTLAGICASGAIVWKEIHTSSSTQSLLSDTDAIDMQPSEYLYIDYAPSHDVSGEVHEKVISNRALFPWLQSHSNNPWRLLKLAQSDNHLVRLLGVKALACEHQWSDYQCRAIAQACDTRTLIGLARTKNVDLRLFLSPPREMPSKNCIEEELRRLLSALPTSGVDKCVQFFTSNALMEGNITEERGGMWCFGGTGLEFTKTLSPVPDEKVEVFCLEALASHSAIYSHCEELVRHGCLQLMMRMVKSKPESFVMKRLIVKILGNIAVNTDLHDDIIRAGWVTVLSEWLSSPDLLLSFHSARTLANLDRDFGSRVYEDGIYLLHPRHRSSEPVYADVIFVHGILGGPFITFRQDDSMREVLPVKASTNLPADKAHEYYTYCWPKDWLAVDSPNLRILSISYDTSLSDWATNCPFEHEKRTLSVRSAAIMEKLQRAGVGSRPIIWVGHSMGGLLVKQMLSQAVTDGDEHGIARNTCGLVFYSVPHRGSTIASASTQAGFIVNPSVEVQELSKDSLMLKRLHMNFHELIRQRKIPILSFGEAKKTSLGLKLSMLVVPPESSDPGIGEFHPIDMDHITICKPRDKNSILYQMTLNFIRHCIPQNIVDNVIKASMTNDDLIVDTNTPWFS